jgi:gelsolin
MHSLKTKLEQGLHEVKERAKAGELGGLFHSKPYAISGSNIEHVGGNEERLAKLKAASTSNEFQNAGKEDIEIWRIEDFVAKSWPKNKYGSFFEGDSFIILKRYGDPKNPDYHLHFWLGKKTTQDEAGAAAYKTVELDTLLNDRPVQHREVQGHESDLFLSHFPKGIRVMDGGYESTKWHHVTPSSEDESLGVAHLLHVRGNGRNVTATEVPATADSLNSGDVFILDDEKKHIIVWFGSSSSPFEKSKASEIAETIETERASKARSVTIDEDQSGPDADLFWQLLGGKKKPRPASEAHKTRALPFAEKKLLKVDFDASGNASFNQVASGGDIKKSQLDSNSVFIVDGINTVYVWVGKNAAGTDKLQAYYAAESYLRNQQERGLLPIASVKEGHTPLEFNSVFPA